MDFFFTHLCVKLLPLLQLQVHLAVSEAELIALICSIGRFKESFSLIILELLKRLYYS